MPGGAVRVGSWGHGVRGGGSWAAWPAGPAWLGQLVWVGQLCLVGFGRPRLRPVSVPSPCGLPRSRLLAGAWGGVGPASSGVPGVPRVPGSGVPGASVSWGLSGRLRPWVLEAVCVRGLRGRPASGAPGRQTSVGFPGRGRPAAPLPGLAASRAPGVVGALAVLGPPAPWVAVGLSAHDRLRGASRAAVRRPRIAPSVGSVSVDRLDGGGFPGLRRWLVSPGSGWLAAWGVSPVGWLPWDFPGVGSSWAPPGRLAHLGHPRSVGPRITLSRAGRPPVAAGSGPGRP